MINLFGSINNSGEFVETSHSLHGAKLAANKRGHHVVAERSPLGYNIEILARKLKSGTWVDDRPLVVILKGWA